MNPNFINYTTGIAFSLQLTQAQIRLLIGLGAPENSILRLTSIGHHRSPEALIYKGLVEYENRKLVLTEPGKLVYKLLDEAGLITKSRKQAITPSMMKEIQEGLTP